MLFSQAGFLPPSPSTGSLKGLIRQFLVCFLIRRLTRTGQDSRFCEYQGEEGERDLGRGSLRVFWGGVLGPRGFLKAQEISDRL